MLLLVTSFFCPSLAEDHHRCKKKYDGYTTENKSIQNNISLKKPFGNLINCLFPSLVLKISIVTLLPQRKIIDLPLFLLNSSIKGKLFAKINNMHIYSLLIVKLLVKIKCLIVHIVVFIADVQCAAFVAKPKPVLPDGWLLARVKSASVSNERSRIVSQSIKWER